MTLSVADADSWYDTLKEKGVSIEREIQTQPWGARDFIVHDPFDNVIVITSSQSTQGAGTEPTRGRIAS